jgi:histidyl-tRNA synthetase
MQKPSIPKGTRDFTPEEMTRRNYIFNTIRDVFRLYGFQQIETPAMENLSTLMGKYGEEGDKLLFKILNSGDFVGGVDVAEWNDRNSSKLTSKISEKGLRYDLTVPFARFVVQNRDKISFPFKRYQIQPVWRADRPQKGRYREFYQCDADVVGSDSLLNEVELLQIIDEVYDKFGLDVTIKINNRKILGGIAEFIGAADRMVDIAIAIDKYDKIDKEGVVKELTEKGFSETQIRQLTEIFLVHSNKVIYGDRAVKESRALNQLNFLIQGSEYRTSESLQKGVEELQYILGTVESLGLRRAKIEFDITLARGLNYYTGAILEVKADGVEMGSISGGGRYDNLTGVFGMPGVSGVGISFGADRIYDVLNQLELYPETAIEQTKVLFACFGEEEIAFSLKWLQKLRRNGVNAEIYPEPAKIKRQMNYADCKKIPFVAIVGETELNQEKVMLKNMKTGEQKLLSFEDALVCVK